jgi:hypothetical protein
MGDKSLGKVSRRAGVLGENKATQAVLFHIEADAKAA